MFGQKEYEESLSILQHWSTKTGSNEAKVGEAIQGSKREIKWRREGAEMKVLI